MPPSFSWIITVPHTSKSSSGIAVSASRLMCTENGFPEKDEGISMNPSVEGKEMTLAAVCQGDEGEKKKDRRQPILLSWQKLGI